MKKYIITGLIIIILVLISLFSFRSISYNNKINVLKDVLNKINIYSNKISIYNQGSIDVIANYKGVHGESFPNSFQYDYSLIDNKIKIISDTYYEKEINLLNIIDLIKKIDNTLINVKEKKYNFNSLKIVLDKKIINEKLDLNFNNVYMLIDSDIYLYLDDIKILIRNDLIECNYKNNVIKVLMSENNYSININNQLKINAFIKENKYNIVINDNAYFISYKDDEINIDFRSQVNIYNEINLIIKPKNSIKTSNKKILNVDEIPFIRYLKNANLEVLR